MNVLTFTHFDNRRKIQQIQDTDEYALKYIIPELVPIHSFSLDREEPFFLDQNQPQPNYSRPQPVDTSSIATMPSDHYNPTLGPYDSLQNHAEEAYSIMPTPPRPAPSPDESDLRCVIGTHLVSGLDVSSISNELKVLLNYMCPFNNVPLGLTELIIFGRRLTDVHILIKDQHVSGQQFIIKFKLESDSYKLIILNHGSQNIKLTSMCGTKYKILEKSEFYVFNSEDDLWLSISGIENVMWRITVNGKIHNKETVSTFTLENKYFNQSLYASAMRKEDCLQPLPLPGHVNIYPLL